MCTSWERVQETEHTLFPLSNSFILITKKRVRRVKTILSSGKKEVKLRERMRGWCEKRRADVATPAVSILKRKKRNFQIKEELLPKKSKDRMTEIKEMVEKESDSKEEERKSDIKRMGTEPPEISLFQTTPFITFIPSPLMTSKSIGKRNEIKWLTEIWTWQGKEK